MSTQVIGTDGSLLACNKAWQKLWGVDPAMLGGFNLLPGYPLDGGRVLESIVWGVTGKLENGVRAAALAGQAIAYILIGYGFFLAIRAVK